MELRITISGEVVDRQELLNGTQSVTLAGVSEDGAWTLSGDIAWNRGLVDFAGEGDFTLTRENDDEIFATATRIDPERYDEDAAAVRLRAIYDIDGGTGEFTDASGSATGEPTIAGDAFSGSWSLALD
jgi:hypothetical protein